MKRQIIFGFTGALVLGVFLAMGACNKHNFKDTEFDTGTQAVFKPHGGGDHGDDHGAEGGHGEGKGHDSDKDAHHKHDKGHDGDKHNKSHDETKEHKDSHKQPAKTLFPQK